MRKVAVFTGDRSELGHIDAIYRAIDADGRLSGKVIDVRGYNRDRGPLGTSVAIGKLTKEVAMDLDNIKPDIMVVYGDRLEAFAAVIAATQMHIPTAHVEGGDYTEGGALDDSVRHAITKLAHLHFATNKRSAEKIRSMGEEAWRVHTVGLPILDLVRDGIFDPPEDVRRKLSLTVDQPTVVFCQHAVSTEWKQAKRQIKESIAALQEAKRKLGTQVVVILHNNDPGAADIAEEINNSGVCKKIVSPDRSLYHGLLNISTCMVGNSSAGIKEAPSFGIPCINIGSRQRGRLRSGFVIDVTYDREQIYEAMASVLYLKLPKHNPEYDTGESAGKAIARVVASCPLDLRLVQKRC